MDLQTLNTELSQYGTVAFSAMSETNVVAFVEGVSFEELPSIHSIVSTLKTDFPNLISYSYDGSSIKFQLVSGSSEGDAASNETSNANE